MKRTLNTTINCSKSEKNGEFYTQYNHIRKEVNAYMHVDHIEGYPTCCKTDMVKLPAVEWITVGPYTQ